VGYNNGWGLFEHGWEVHVRLERSVLKKFNPLLSGTNDRTMLFGALLDHVILFSQAEPGFILYHPFSFRTGQFPPFSLDC
jgi:hypothetical protein